MKRLAAYLAFFALVVCVASDLHGCEKPDDAAAFWWTWWVYVLSAVGSLAAVVVALFIDQLRPWASPPLLELRIRQERGNPAVHRVQPQGPGMPGRWYHLQIWNRNRRVATVHGVRIMLTEIWKAEQQAGKLVKIWDEEVAMVWPRFDGDERTIGAQADCDLCSVVRGRPVVVLETKGFPFSMPRELASNTSHVAVFRARGDEVDSARFCVEITWDGVFSEDEARMAEHLKVRPADDPAPKSP
jgi:hypothetical protein